jgi:hypothetical protein
MDAMGLPRRLIGTNQLATFFNHRRCAAAKSTTSVMSCATDTPPRQGAVFATPRRVPRLERGRCGAAATSLAMTQERACCEPQLARRRFACKPAAADCSFFPLYHQPKKNVDGLASEGLDVAAVRAQRPILGLAISGLVLALLAGSAPAKALRDSSPDDVLLHRGGTVSIGELGRAADDGDELRACRSSLCVWGCTRSTDREERRPPAWPLQVSRHPSSVRLTCFANANSSFGATNITMLSAGKPCRPAALWADAAGSSRHSPARRSAECGRASRSRRRASAFAI